MADDDGLGSFRDDGPAGETETDAPELFYGSVNEFVRDKLTQTYRRQVGERTQHRWADDWWRYGEAVSRLEALWRSWEALRLDPATGMSVWWRDHADHHMPILLSTDGPFARATASNNPGDPLPHTEPPEGLFPDMRTGSA